MWTVLRESQASTKTRVHRRVQAHPQRSPRSQNLDTKSSNSPFSSFFLMYVHRLTILLIRSIPESGSFHMGHVPRSQHDMLENYMSKAFGPTIWLNPPPFQAPKGSDASKARAQHRCRHLPRLLGRCRAHRGQQTHLTGHAPSPLQATL